MQSFLIIIDIFLSRILKNIYFKHYLLKKKKKTTTAHSEIMIIILKAVTGSWVVIPVGSVLKQVCLSFFIHMPAENQCAKRRTHFPVSWPAYSYQNRLKTGGSKLKIVRSLVEPSNFFLLLEPKVNPQLSVFLCDYLCEWPENESLLTLTSWKCSGTQPVVQVEPDIFWPPTTLELPPLFSIPY